MLVIPFEALSIYRWLLSKSYQEMGTREEPELCFVWQLYREVWILRCLTNCIFVTSSCTAEYSHMFIEIATPPFSFRLYVTRTRGEIVRWYGLLCWHVRSAQLYIFSSKVHNTVTELIKHLKDVSRWLLPYLRHDLGKKNLINGHLYLLILVDFCLYAVSRFGNLLGIVITLTWHQTIKHVKN